MKKMHKKGIKTFCITTFIAGIVFSGNVLATDLNIELTKEYEKWNELIAEEKENTLMPKTYSANVPDDVLEDVSEKEIPSLITELTGSWKLRSNKIVLENAKASYTDSTYNIANRLSLRVEHQGITDECWAFSMIKSLETNIALRSGITEIPDFSERHMDYATSKTFKDGINKKGFEREVEVGGLPVTALAYLTNGQGAVLESDMPFENNKDKITLNSIDKEVDTVVTEYSSLPVLYKTYNKDSKGNTTSVTYTDASGNVYNNEQVKAIRNIIKQHIIEDGAVPSMTAASQTKYYNDSNDIFNAINYNCNNTTHLRDHAITIVGWDDNYSKDNFKEGAKPSTNGAYIVLNSYGEENFNNGYMYISYEDFFIESELYVIKNSEEKDFDKIYQADFYGGIFSMGTASIDTGYFGNTYERDESKTEYITNVGVTVPDYVDVEIYINPNDDSMKPSSLIKIGENTELLEPGYHRIEVEPTKLNGKKFAIVVKQKSANGIFYFSVESPVANTAYACVDSDNNSYYSFDGENWVNLSRTQIQGFDMTKTDVCIKAFCVESINEEDEKPEENKLINSEKYLISENVIYKIVSDTSINEFKNNVETENNIKIFDGDKEITENNTIIKTGMRLKLDNEEEYVLIVRGDINCDGKVTLTDLSKLILHYNETRGFILTGNPYEAADMNYDKKVSLVDVSQMLVLYNSK